jgi:hypothetical protein
VSQLAEENAGRTCRYFVDEAGDPTLFSRNGRVLIGTEGCSRFFILGMAEVANPKTLSDDLEELRRRLLGDSYFKGVPSMQPEARKTALAFHATDDLPEVRREVFALLSRQDIRFFAVVRDKQAVLEYVRQRNEQDRADRADAAARPNNPFATLTASRPAYRYHPNELYDLMVRRLFLDRLHKEDAYEIVFAQRGSSDRTAALTLALQTARQRFAEKHGVTSSARTAVAAASSHQSPGLQAVDYLLWALQRLYERGEERYVALMWPLFRLVHDVDDTRRTQYGVYYTKRTPLTLSAIKRAPEI